MYGFKQVLLFVVVLGLWVVASQVSATTLFHDDFQSDTNLANPAIGSGDIGGSWTTIEGQSDRIQVVQDGPNPTDGRYVQSSRVGSSGTIRAYAAQTWAVLNSGDVSQTLNNPTVTLSCSVFNDGTVTGANSPSGPQPFDITLCDAQPASSFPSDLFRIAFNANGTIQYWDHSLASGAGAFVSLANVTYTVTAWQNVTLTANMAAKTFTLAVAGHGSDTGSWGGNYNEIQSVAFYSNGGGGRGYVDNVQIEAAVPEPSALVMLLSAGLGLLAYAWRGRR